MSRDPDAPVAELDAVTRTYGGVPVLDSASLAVEPGLTAVIGPNGSGKSTLLGVLAGTADPTAGAVRRPAVDGDGFDAADNADNAGDASDAGDADDAVKPVGYLPQRVPFREGFTARETLAFYARLIGANPDAALADVGLADAADRRVEALSGGMVRLLGIAQATLGDPPLVVLDEPASGLDPGMRERAFRTAAERAGAGTAVVVSSHNLDLVDDHADAVVVLARGRVVAAGDLDALCDEHGVAGASELYRAVTGDGGDGTDGESDGDRNGDSDRSDAEPGDERDAVHVTGVSRE
ncbi:ABC transporter [Halorubrum aidingense JCM 13560]|uniref:ABC transporter n=1 Tax=Halorubrum aidingense JCM 13560 TaxID=1230454 RepID=M0PBS4_9EURY|nr:ABC transporter ATP-binding protein [Halorubrum aidingense]EMA67476.1 ABC transporter [Halorubrum aidingense JCM 13560]